VFDPTYPEIDWDRTEIQAQNDGCSLGWAIIDIEGEHVKSSITLKDLSLSLRKIPIRYATVPSERLWPWENA